MSRRPRTRAQGRLARSRCTSGRGCTARRRGRTPGRVPSGTDGLPTPGSVRNGNAPQRLVQEGRMEGLDVGVAIRPELGVDLQPQGRSVGRPKSSWLNQLPNRPMAWASTMPGASASASGGAGCRAAWPRSTRQGRPSRWPPDAETALPDLQRIDGIGAGSEVRLPVRGDVIEPRTHDAERHGPHRDVPTTPGAPPRAIHRRLPTQIPTRMPARMHSAYARIGIGPSCHTAFDGLGMEAGSWANTTVGTARRYPAERQLPAAAATAARRSAGVSWSVASSSPSTKTVGVEDTPAARWLAATLATHAR